MMYSNKVFISSGFYYTIFRIKNRIILALCEKLKKVQKYILNAIKWEYKLKTDTYNAAQIHTAKKVDFKNGYQGYL